MKSSRQKIAAASLGFVLACCPFTFAIDSFLDVNQYAHTAWKIREGFSKGEIGAITQTADGYIWLGTEFGLIRFDGVRTVEWKPPQDQHLPSNTIYSLLAARDGTLWIGTTKGLASWKNGKLTEYAELAGQAIFAVIEDREGTIWVGGIGLPSAGRLCAIQGGKVRCFGKDGSLGSGVRKLYEDSRGNLWAATDTGVWRWKPSNAQYYPVTEPSSFSGLAEDSGGAILISTDKGVSRLVDGRIEVYPLPGTVQQFKSRSLLRDRDGSLWIGILDRGLLHVHGGRTDLFASSDGLSGDRVNDLFQDREGNIWVATINGLDRFRGFAVRTFTVKQGLSNASVQSVMADKEGNIWLGTAGGLDRWTNGNIATYDKRQGKLDGLPPESLFQDSGGRIWVSTRRSFGYLVNYRFVPLSAVPGGFVAITQDSTGNLWVAHPDHGLFRLQEERVVQNIPWAGLSHKDFATALAADLNRGLWLGFFNGGLAYLADGGVRASYTAGDGLGEGRVNYLRIGSDGTLWAATEGGLSRLNNGRIATLTSKNGLPCDAVNWVIEDDDHSFWLYMSCGLVRIARLEMDGWAAAADQDKNTKHTVKATVFDSSDGVRTIATVGLGAQVAKSADGKLWFLPWDGVSVIDPQHLPFNRIPPPVHIEKITADGKTYGVASDLRPNVRELEIDYTALSLVIPEKVRFRYKLEGFERDWQDAGNRRQAFYTNLPPRNYRFRVIACNNSGVWNDQGATLDFVIPPAWYQTNWFRAACIFAFLAMIWGAYEFRVRQLAYHFNMRLEERVSERTRIAREIHDTLLQSFHGLLMNFQTASRLLPAGATEAKQKLDSAIEQAEEAILEGREAVQGLRASTIQTNDLAQAISALGEELATDSNNQPTASFNVAVEGASRDLHPILRDEIYRIAVEALRNAFRHAQARTIEVEIRYGDQEFRLRVRDDGRGFDPAVSPSHGREGHYGLPGMKERAKIAGGKLTVWSEVDAGTEVELQIPAGTAYAKAPRRSWLSEKLVRKAVGRKS